MNAASPPLWQRRCGLLSFQVVCEAFETFVETECGMVAGIVFCGPDVEPVGGGEFAGDEAGDAGLAIDAEDAVDIFKAFAG